MLTCSGTETAVEKVIQSHWNQTCSAGPLIHFKKLRVFLLPILVLFPVSPEKGAKYNILLHPALCFRYEPGILFAAFPSMWGSGELTQFISYEDYFISLFHMRVILIATCHHFHFARDHHYLSNNFQHILLLNMMQLILTLFKYGVS